MEKHHDDGSRALSRCIGHSLISSKVRRSGTSAAGGADITRCVRRALLLGEGPSNRKEWIERRLEELSGIFAVAVGGFSVLDNHLHVVVRLDPDTARGWSDEEVVRRWGRLFAPRDKSRQPLPVSNDWVQWRLKDARWVATARERLQSLSWFMKCLKEPLARLANRQEQTRGAFFEERFKSVTILDEESLLATCAYIDLNPVAAGIAKVPEKSPHTSINQRVAAVRAQDFIFSCRLHEVQPSRRLKQSALKPARSRSRLFRPGGDAGPT
jgi:REP element-mobilizing transposase RayT